MSSDEKPNGAENASGAEGAGGQGEKVISLLPWDITVRRARSKRHGHELIERKDADEAIRALSPIESYYVVKELGLESSVPILSVLEPDQIRTLVDLDCWRDDRVALEDLTSWLAGFQEAGPAALDRVMRSIDPEVLAYLFQERLHIALKPREDDETPGALPEWLTNPPEEIQPLVETADHRFIIAARKHAPGDEDRSIDEEERKQVLALVETLYGQPDFEFVAGVLRLAESDQASALEEDAYQFRTGRLEDLGFPERTRALEIYGPLDPDRVLQGKERVLAPEDLRLPALHAERLSEGLLARALGALEDPEVVRRIEGELIAIANAALVVDHVEPGDLEHLRVVLDRVRAYLELALAHAVPPESFLEVAKARLTSLSMRTIFRAGHALTLALSTRARALAARGAFAVGGRPLALLSDTERAVLEALMLVRPRYSRALDEPPLAFETRPFASSGDLERVRTILEDLESLAAAAEALGLSGAAQRVGGAGIDPPLPERTAEVLLATAAARAVLGADFTFEALDARELAALARMLDPSRTFPEPRVAEAFARASAAARRPEADPALGRRVTEGLAALARALAPLVGAGEIDPRYVGVVLRRVG